MQDQISIAVLPFKNMSSDKENDYFCDGITEEIINALARIGHLKITSRTSSFFFRDKNLPITDIGKKLKVSIILEGSVRISGNTIRITAQLIQVEDDFHFWSETWDRKLENIFIIQDEISLLIADKIRENFGHLEINDKLVNKQTDYLEAYRLYLKGNYHFQKWNPEDINLSKKYYEEALAIDPNHAQSNFGLSQYYAMMAGLGFLPKEEAFREARIYANKALEMNAQLPEAHHGLATISYWYDWDLKKTMEHLNRALEINPNFAPAYAHLAFHHCSSGNPKKALENIEIAISLDPLSSEVYFAKGYIYYITEDYETSLKNLDTSLELNPFNLLSIVIKTSCWVLQGKTNLVIDYFNSDLPPTIDKATIYGMLGISYATEKNRAETDKYLNLLAIEIKNSQAERAQFFVFLIHVILGENEKVFVWLKKIINSKPTLLLLLFSDPMINPIKENLEYKKIIKKVFSDTFVPENKISKKKDLLTEDLKNTYSKKLVSYMEEDSPYLDPNLSLKDLAKYLDIHSNQLSWLINFEFHKNFNEYINHYRVEAFKKNATDNKNAHITLIGLAYESGFNSKTVFNTFFKKETGMTPVQYLKGQN